MKYTMHHTDGGWAVNYTPMIITAEFEAAKDYSIRARTHTSHGCKLFLLDEKGKVAFTEEYSYITCDPGFHSKMAVDIADNINFLFEIESKSERIASADLEQIMFEVSNKCESLHGGELPQYDYEALVVFK